MTGPRRIRAVQAQDSPQTRCPKCGKPVLTTPRGELLDPEPHPLAVILPDGKRLTVRQAVDVLTGRSEPIGHHPHHERGYGCTPQAQQLSLFAA